MKTAVLFGAGQMGAMISRLVGAEYSVIAFADNFEKKWGTRLCNIPVVSPAEAVAINPDAVFICVLDDERAGAMSAQLASLGFTVREWKQKLSARHLFTHIEWQMQGYIVEVRGANEDIGFCDEKQFHACAIPGAFRKFVAATEEYIKE